MLRKNSTVKIVCKLLLIVVFINCLPEPAGAQHSNVPKEPFQVVDTSTGRTIPEILVLPGYSSGTGVFVATEGPSKSAVRHYLDNPFIYRSGTPFIIKQPKVFVGLPLLFVFIGKANDLNGILVIAPGYHPQWTDDLWCCPWDKSYKRKLELTPISDKGWSLLLEKELIPLIKEASRITEHCDMWGLSETCTLEIDYNKKERELVRSFLQRAK